MCCDGGGCRGLWMFCVGCVCKQSCVVNWTAYCRLAATQPAGMESVVGVAGGLVPEKVKVVFKTYGMSHTHRLKSCSA